MQEELVKSLEVLIDESLAEIEELKKSERFSASEISIGDSKSGIKDQEKNGSLDKEEDCDGDSKKDKKDDDEEDDDYDKDMDKAEGKNRESDPNGGSHQPIAKDEHGMDKAEGKNSESDTTAGKHTADGGAPMVKSVEERFEKLETTMEKIEAHLAKSVKEIKTGDEELNKSETEKTTAKPSEAKEDLFKSYVDEKFSSIENKFENIAKLVQEIADSPIPSKSVSYKDVQPLKKSDEEMSTLSKSDITDKLLELKKSGTAVDSLDITSVELGGPDALAKIVNKYNIN